MGICPFSQSADKAGLPVGPVHYPLSRNVRPEDVYATYWHEVRGGVCVGGVCVNIMRT